jgi:hypothetical protein
MKKAPVYKTGLQNKHRGRKRRFVKPAYKTSTEEENAGL